MGHAWTFTFADVYARKMRLMGKEVLFPMGWDAFGLPAENYAIKTGIKPQIITKKNIDTFKNQMKNLELSFDWGHEVNTTDPSYYRWTQWIFLQMFKHGLAYKSATPVGWCPSCKIVLANEEIVNDKCERCGTPAEERIQKQWVLRITSYADRLDKELDTVDYSDHIKTAQRNWIGQKEWIDIAYQIENSNQTVTVSTTRPDTNFGATFIVIAPEHPLVASLKNNPDVANYVTNAKSKTDAERIANGRKKTGVFTGLYAINQLNGTKMPIWIADFALMSVGTGAVVGVPASDIRDFEFAKEFKLPIIRVIIGEDNYDGPIETLNQVCEEGTLINSEFLNGLKRDEAIPKMMDFLESKGWGKRKMRYHLRDWIFSRQHYWGEPTPMIFCEQCHSKGITWWQTEEGKNFKPLFNPQEPEHFDNKENPVDLAGWFPMKEEDLPLTLPDVEKYQPSDDGTSPLAAIKNWIRRACPVCGEAAIGETDVMPNWAGSSWYYIRYCDPKNETHLSDESHMAHWLPVDLYLGGAEHMVLHLLYSRFWHKFLNDIKVAPGIEPYRSRRHHGMILAENGSKMSKSKGNVINPNDIVLKYGADVVRTYLCFIGPFDQTMPWNTKGIEGVRRFYKKVEAIYQSKNKIAKDTTPHLKAKLAQTIKRVGESVDNLKHNTAVAALMEFTNEWEKSGTLSSDDAQKFLTMLSIFAPSAAEALLKALPAEALAKAWPTATESDLQVATATIVISINGKPRSTLEISSQKANLLDKDEVVNMAKKDERVSHHLAGEHIKNIIYVPGKILNFVTG